jgi:hypothetical protein
MNRPNENPPDGIIERVRLWWSRCSARNASTGYCRQILSAHIDGITPSLPKKDRSGVQGAIGLTFRWYEHDGTGRNVVLACRNKSNDRHIGGDINFHYLYRSPSLFDRQRPGIGHRRICHHA